MHEKLIEVPDEGMAGVGCTVPAGLEERIDRVLIPEGALAERISALAERICIDYRGADRITFLIVLEGARVFAEDLCRAIARLDGPAVEYDYVRARTYGEEIKGDGETERSVSITLQPGRLEGRHVVVVEDIVDQGFTLTRIRQLVIAKRPASMRICTLLLKRLNDPTPAVRRLREELHVSYAGFEVPDSWVAGYGIDVGGELRELPFIVAVNESYYAGR